MGAGDLVSFWGLGISLKREKRRPKMRKTMMTIAVLMSWGFWTNEEVDFLNC